MRRFLKSNILSANLLCCCCLSVVEPSQTRKAGIFRIVFRWTLSRFIWMCANVGRFSPVVLSNCTRSCARQPRSSAPTSDFHWFSKDPSPTKWLSENSRCFCPSTRRRRIFWGKMNHLFNPFLSHCSFQMFVLKGPKAYESQSPSARAYSSTWEQIFK